MLELFFKKHPDQLITAYTRNPALIGAMGRAAHVGAYPLVSDPELQRTAAAMPHATTHSAIAYHVNRYEPGGLFQGFDPADSPATINSPPLKRQFSKLSNIRTALVIAAKTGSK